MIIIGNESIYDLLLYVTLQKSNMEYIFQKASKFITTFILFRKSLNVHKIDHMDNK